MQWVPHTALSICIVFTVIALHLQFIVAGKSFLSMFVSSTCGLYDQPNVCTSKRFKWENFTTVIKTRNQSVKGFALNHSKKKSTNSWCFRNAISNADFTSEGTMLSYLFYSRSKAQHFCVGLCTTCFVSLSRTFNIHTDL